MIKKIVIVLAVLIAVLLIVASFQPDTMEVTRSTTIAAPPAAVFAVVNDFRRWDEWSPWAKLDPEMTKTLEGPPTGVGA
ncbi:MAG: SRPBCC family protein, partial [Verrucomicrobiae bacterium]|nr:SRPBCC family protein [Verrucomicrobiae bacterium]